MNKNSRNILRSAREVFASSGFYGSRIDAIAELAHVNRKFVYDFCHTKDELYMTVLSEVSREVMSYFNSKVPQMKGSVRDIYAEVFDALENFSDFIRLWAWERMSTTIHGPRILETVNAIFEKVRQLIQAQIQNGEIEADDVSFDTIEALSHGYLLTAAMYFRCDPETDGAEEPLGEGEPMAASPALRRLNMSMELQHVTLNAIEKLATHYE